MSFRLPRSRSQSRAAKAALFVWDDAMTEQSHRDSCDINVLMRKYEKTGEIPLARGAAGEPNYGDFTGVSDYQSAINAVLEAESAFMSMPASLRSKFDNDPGRLLAFVEDDANYDKAVEYGLLPPKVVADASNRDVIQAIKASAPKVPKRKPTE